MKKLRVIALMDEELVPPDTMEGYTEQEILDWKTEFDVVTTLGELGHDTVKLGVSNDLGVIQRALADYRPHIVFNLLEEFHGVAIYDQNVVSYLELKRQPYTGCNPRGLMLAHDKALSKQLLSHHRILTPNFVVFERGRSVRSIVSNVGKLRDRTAFVHEQIQTDALVEEYIEGRELYVGVIGNQRLFTLPIWEMLFENLPENTANIATRRAKWDSEYQKQLGIKTQAARDVSASQAENIAKLCKRVYRALHLSGYARMDLRMANDGQVYILEANPNPNLSYGEDLAESAEVVGISYEALIQRILNLGLNYRAPWREF